MFFNDVWLTFISFTYKSESENIILVLPNENHDASHCSVLKYKLTKDGARAATAMTSFVRLLPLCKKIIPGIECAICVEYCLGAPYRPLPGFLRWVARYFWSDDDTLFQFDVQKVVINGEA